MHKMILGVTLVVIVGCGSLTVPSGIPNVPKAEPTASPSVETPTDAPSTESPQERAQKIVARANAVIKRVVQAVRLDGTQQTIDVARQIEACGGTEQDCTDLANGLVATSKVGAHAGLAANLADRAKRNLIDTLIIAVEPDVAEAEKQAAMAMGDAKTIAEVRAAEQAKFKAEQDAIQAAVTACASTPNACKVKCESGDGPSCVAWATKLWKGTPPKLADAKTAMTKACEAGVQTACAMVHHIDSDIQNASAQLDSLWSDVTDAGDDLAQKYHQVAMVMKLANTRHLQGSVQKMQIINQAIVEERYCPAKKAFLAGASAGEFQKRAADHCKTAAPTGQGLSGAEVTLTAECSQVYATPCP